MVPFSSQEIPVRIHHQKAAKRRGGNVSTFNWWMRACTLFLLWETTAIALPAQTFKSLHSFDEPDGAAPRAGLVQATNGNFYGTTVSSGTYGFGTVFEITLSGTLTTLHSFDGTDGSEPEAGLVQATNGNFYGTTYEGGAHSIGTVFKITPSGTLTSLHSFDDTDGFSTYATLVQGTNGDLYGTTWEGGANGDGTVFKITTSGMLTTLHSFDGTDGSQIYAGLVQGTDGNFYGTTYEGGANFDGTVFKITPSGTLTTLHSFDGTDGEDPYAGLVQGTDGDLYGTTQLGGAHGGGTVFKITLSGKLTTLHSFCSRSGCTDGFLTYATLVQGTNGDLYGTTALGGAKNSKCLENECGTVFKITTSGTLTTLHSFEYMDGATPEAALVQDTNGDFYGTTEFGGTHNAGTVFRLSLGLGPFVETQPTSGKVGAAVKILGTNLTGATKVTFNGTLATFTVVSSSEITTTVPTGATTGNVKVTTPSGTLTSNVNFRVP
jgi:uncharacterized repeat protein (TIGR03803 family)